MRGTDEPPVDFIVIGAAKCATTWLQEALGQAPGVWMPGPEPHFFSRHYDLGLDWYRAQLAGAGDARIVGEKSNSYLTAPAAAERIRRHLPDVRLIVQMREPVARAYSDYCMLFRRGEVSGEIRRHLDPDRAAGGRFLDHGRYAHHLARFHAAFGAGAILPLLTEETVADPARHLGRAARHVGLPGTPPLPRAGRVKDGAAPVVPRPLRRLLRPARALLDPIRHTAPLRALRGAVARPVAYPPLPPDLAHEIWDFYHDDVGRLERMTCCDLTIWRAAAEARRRDTGEARPLADAT